MNMQDVIATFGSMEKARERIEDICEHTDDEVEAIVGLALLGLDSLAAADPEREAKVEALERINTVIRDFRSMGNPEFEARHQITASVPMVFNWIATTVSAALAASNANTRGGE